MNTEETKKCEICENDLRLTWTDTHGISACMECCSPYRTYKYDDKQVRSIVCESLTLPKYVPLMKRYWNEKKRKIPHNFDMGVSQFEGGRSYSGFSTQDLVEFEKWVHEHRQEIESLK